MDPKHHLVLDPPDSCSTCANKYKCLIRIASLDGARFGYSCISCGSGKCSFTDESLRGRALVAKMIDDAQALLKSIRKATGIRKVPTVVMDLVLAGIDALVLLHDNDDNWKPVKSKDTEKRQDTVKEPELEDVSEGDGDE